MNYALKKEIIAIAIENESIILHRNKDMRIYRKNLNARINKNKTEKIRWDKGQWQGYRY